MGFERMRLALRMMRRELRAGELTVLLAALLVAVAAMSSVGFFTNRVDRALHLQASQLLAADVVINSDQVNLACWQGQLGGLRHTQTPTFPSMTWPMAKASWPPSRRSARLSAARQSPSASMANAQRPADSGAGQWCGRRPLAEQAQAARRRLAGSQRRQPQVAGDAGA